jgi:hypothetical protein
MGIQEAHLKDFEVLTKTDGRSCKQVEQFFLIVEIAQ